jgi:carbon monoxide dehydrogenase subunit G
VNIYNSFVVPLKPNDAWGLLMDVTAVAGCVPGATITEVVDDRSFRGTIRVRLGPVAVTFTGLAQFETIDEPAKSASLKASGEDTAKRGSAHARTHFRLRPVDEGSRVELDTDLQLAGMIAQYGRAAGQIAQLAQELLDQFAENLRKLIAQRKRGYVSGPAKAGEHVVTAPRELPAFGLLWRALMRSLFGQSQASL